MSKASNDEQREDRYADVVIDALQAGEHPHAIARAVMTVADAEQAELRGESEELRRFLSTTSDALERHIQLLDYERQRVAEGATRYLDAEGVALSYEGGVWRDPETGVPSWPVVCQVIRESEWRDHARITRPDENHRDYDEVWRA